MRLGNQVIAPFIQFSNFMMLIYLTINEIIPIYIFAPLFVMGIIISYTLVGNRFRKIQHSTDINLGYEKATKSAGVTYQLFNSNKKIMDHLKIKYPDGFESSMKYLETIRDGKA